MPAQDVYKRQVLHLLAELNQQGITILMTTHDLNAAAAHVPWVICLNRTVIAEGAPEAIFTEDTLNRTYQGDMVVVRQDELLLVQQRPHKRSDLLPTPALGRTGGFLTQAGLAGGPSLTGLIAPVQPAKEVTGELAV